MEEWRVILYPLGFLSGFAFGLRFIIQWLQSEKAKNSVVSPIFWKLSLVGSGFLILHSFIQMQYHVCLIQGLSTVISWRNLNLMQKKSAPLPFHQVIYLFIFAFLLISTLFELQILLSNPSQGWFRVPQAPWQSHASHPVGMGWHLAGFVGYLLFSARFWIQWWISEKHLKSELPLLFWQASILGALFSIVYFYKIDDWVNLIGPVVGIVPYLRNLKLIKNAQTLHQNP